MATSLEEILQQTLSADNAQREAAEKLYQEAKREKPAELVSGLLQAVAAAGLPLAVREQAAVLLRRCLDRASDEADSIWARIGTTGQAAVKQTLLRVLETEPLPKVRRKVADCLQSLANQLIKLLSDARPKNVEEWPELMPTLMRIICDSTKDAGVRADCVWATKELAISIWQLLVASPEQTNEVLRACLADPAPAVRANAAGLLVTLMDNIENRAERKPFQPLVADLASTIAQLAAQPEAALLLEVLQSLHASTETADFCKGHVDKCLMPVLVPIAKAHADEEARKASCEAIICLVENKPKAMVKVPGFIQEALDVCITFILQMDDDVEAWAQVGEAEEEEQEDFFHYGKQAVDRVCRAADKAECFQQVLEVLKVAIAKLFATGEWKQVTAGIATMQQVVEFVDDEAAVEQMFTAIMAQLAAQHPRVRHAAWGAVAQFGQDHPTVVAKDAWTSNVMNAFLQGLEDTSDRVCIRSMEAFQHYGEQVEREDMEPYMQPLMERLGRKLQAGATMQQKAITFIAVIACQVEDAFAPYYGALMPVLKQIISATLHKVEERRLLGKCFECISLLAKAVGRVGFRSDAEQIMEAMIKATKVPNLPDNDPVQEYMMSACERICSALKEDFLPFVPHLLPLVFEKLALAPKELNENTRGDFEVGEGVNLTAVMDNGQWKIMIMHSSEVEDLKCALECVHAFVGALGKSYAPFVSQTAQALLPVFEFNMREDIRDLSFETWAELCGVAREGGQVQLVSQLVLEFLNRQLPKFEDLEVDVDALRTRCDGITACLRRAGPGILSAEQVQHLCQQSMKLLGESLQRRADAEAERRQMAAANLASGCAEEDDIEEDDGSEQKLREALCEIAGAIMKHHPDVFAAAGLQMYLSLVQKLMGSETGASDDVKLALYVTCDFLEHLGERVTSQWEQTIMPLLFRSVVHQDPGVRQPAAYGLSIAAKEPAFAAVAVTAMATLSQVVMEARGRAKKKSAREAQAVADNALSAIVETLIHHEAAVAEQKSQLWNLWLASLPCQMDETEGVRNHGLLLKFLLQERAEVVGENGGNVPRLLGILLDVYKTDMVDVKTSQGIGQLVLRLGEERLKQMAAGFTQKQSKKLLRAVKDAQAGEA